LLFSGSGSTFTPCRRWEPSAEDLSKAVRSRLHPERVTSGSHQSDRAAVGLKKGKNMETTIERRRSEEVTYDHFLGDLQTHFTAMLASGEALLTVPTEGLWEIYLGAIPGEHRQYHTCHACKQFFERFAGLVVVGGGGEIVPAIWQNVESIPEELCAAVEAVRKEVLRRSVDGVFASSKTILGTAECGGFSHLHVTIPARLVHKSSIESAGQRRAVFAEDHKNLSRALGEFKEETLREVVRILKAGIVSRAEKFLVHAEWLLELKTLKPKGQRRSALIWRAVATAPTGWTSPRAQVIGSLIDDLAAGLSTDIVVRNFNMKLAPLQYQRPQAAPTEGNIKRAEEIFAKMDLGLALERRFASVDEVEAIWRPAQASPMKTEGLFGNIAPKGKPVAAPRELAAGRMTVSKFLVTVLPTAARVEVMVPSAGDFVAITTAVNPDAPPLLRWDKDEARNPFAYYRYVRGSSASSFGLVGGLFANVPTICKAPSFWRGHQDHGMKEEIFFLLDGAHDSTKSGSALFPETLRSELHEVRSVIEAHSKQGIIGMAPGPDAAGIASPRERSILRIRCLVDGGWVAYDLDRWD